MDYKRYGKNDDLYQTWNRENGEPALKVIMEGDYRGRHFVIGAHCTGNPNAYLEVKKEDSMYCESEDYDCYDGNLCRVNGGSSYFGRAYWNKDDDRIYVGWDYGHGCDYNIRHPEFGGTVWKLVDIVMEIACAENEIETQNMDDPEYFNRLYKK